MAENTAHEPAASIEDEARDMLVELGEEWAIGHAVNAMEAAKQAGDHGKVLYWLRVIRFMADRLIVHRQARDEAGSRGKLS